MSSVNDIAAAVLATCSALAAVDQASLSEYLPSVTTESVALIIPPFGQTTRVESVGVGNAVYVQSHRLRCEFWVKINTGALATTLAKAREIGLDAAKALLEDKTLGGTVSYVGFYGNDGVGPAIDIDVATVPVQIGQGLFIIATLFLPVVDMQPGTA